MVGHEFYCDINTHIIKEVLVYTTARTFAVNVVVYV